MKKVNIISIILLVLMSALMLFPFFWLIRGSFMTDREIMTLPMQWLPSNINLDNYRAALDRAPFARYFLNSGFVAVTSVIGAVLSSSFVAFGFARLKFPGRDVWFGLLLSTLMIPFTVVMIPQFIGWQAVGAFNTFWPLILPSFFGHAFNVFLMRQFYFGIPKEYDEAALVDGANYFTIYVKIILPMSKPALCAVGVFTFMAAWNDFIGPLLYLADPYMRTVSLGLQIFVGQFTASINQLMAASTVAVLPMIIVFFVAQRYFIEGITFSGLKG
ncbi:MAG: carbohydrate ABC transporter permease [Oscillospiraceae bacterium]|nr:carbohydrate ABC transporter permease [Oscillospiraceae bacterium]